MYIGMPRSSDGDSVMGFRSPRNTSPLISFVICELASKYVSAAVSILDRKRKVLEKEGRRWGIPNVRLRFLAVDITGYLASEGIN